MNAVPAPLVAALKRVSLGDHVVGQDAAVAPAADAELVRIGDAHLDDLIDHRLEIVDFVVAPVGPDRSRELRAAPGAAAVVDREHRVAVGGEPLPLEREAVLILTVRAAVNPQQHRDLRARDVAGGVVSRPWTSVPSLLFARDLFGRRRTAARRTARRSDA